MGSHGFDTDSAIPTSDPVADECHDLVRSTGAAAIAPVTQIVRCAFLPRLRSAAAQAFDLLTSRSRAREPRVELLIAKGWVQAALPRSKVPLLWILHVGYLWIPGGRPRSSHGLARFRRRSSERREHALSCRCSTPRTTALPYSLPALFGRSPLESTSQVRRRSSFPRASI
jgi:hypothetical protein